MKWIANRRRLLIALIIVANAAAGAAVVQRARAEDLPCPRGRVCHCFAGACVQSWQGIKCKSSSGCPWL